MKKEENIEEFVSNLFDGFEPNVDNALWLKIKTHLEKKKTIIEGSKKSIIKKSFFTIGISSVVFTVFLLSFFSQEQKQKNIKKETAVFEKNIEKKKEKQAVKNQKKKKKEKKIEEKKEKKRKQQQLTQEASLKEKKIEEKEKIIKHTPLAIVEIKKKKEKKIEEKKEIEPPIKTIEKTIPETAKQLKEEAEIFVPNVFTPNNDGKNDRFIIKTRAIKEFSITILNTKNEAVFHSVDTSFVWDGKDVYQNNLPEGNYVYFIIAKNKRGEPIKKHGFLFLKR